MKVIIAKLRRFTLPKTVKIILLIVLPLLIIDVSVAVLVAVLGTSYHSENNGNFWSRPPTVILSDLLFLEGALIFAIGTFVAVEKATLKTKPSRKPTTEITDNTKQALKKEKNPGILALIIGAILIGLSIIIGSLPY